MVEHRILVIYINFRKNILHLIMSSRTIFLKNCPTERKRGKKNCPTGRNRGEKNCPTGRNST